MAGLDRDLQLRILRVMADAYPERIQPERAFADVDESRLTSNLHYLYEHGLIDASWSRTLNEPICAVSAVATARGMDFLADDGGLSAILRVVTVKLDEDTLKALLIERIDASDQPLDVKERLIEQARSLPADAMRSLTLEAMKAGLAQWQNVLWWLQK